MIIIINGSIGVGKTAVSRALNELIEKPSVMLDGDYIGAVQPFDMYDNNRTEYLYKTITHLIKHHIENDYNNFVMNYVFENQAQLDSLTDKLKPLNLPIATFWLVCNEKEQLKRIIKRNNADQLDWEPRRAIELNGILEKASALGFIGEKIETSEINCKEVARIVLEKQKNREA